MIRHNCNHNSYFSTYVMKTNVIYSTCTEFGLKKVVRDSRTVTTWGRPPYPDKTWRPVRSDNDY